MWIQYSWENFAQATPRWGVRRVGWVREGWQIDVGVCRWYVWLGRRS